MSKQSTLIRKRNCIEVRPSTRPRQVNSQDPRALAFQSEVMRLGYILSEDVIQALSTLSDNRINDVYKNVIESLRHITGADVTWKPFYPNFPRQVQEASEWELFYNAIFHYWSFGQWIPEYDVEARLPALENVKFKALGLAGPDDTLAVFNELLGANASITDNDRSILSEIMTNFPEDRLTGAVPDSIPFKETLCWFVAECINRDFNVLGMAALKTATDILRVVTHLSGGDISLATNTRFKSLSRPLRRAIVNRLNTVANLDDVMRHRGKWVRLAHSLHIGEYKTVCPHAVDVLASARNSDCTYQTFDGAVEYALENGNKGNLVGLLKERPGMFARRLDHVIRTFGSRGVVNPFLSVSDQVDTRVLLQLYGHFNSRNQKVNRRVVFPKGGTATSHLLTNTLPALTTSTVQTLRDGIGAQLESRFSTRDGWGSVYIDPALKECPIPLSLRSASEGMRVVARGTKIPLTQDNNTLRMFIYWKGQDIDLSGFFVNEDFTRQDTISYYNLRTQFAHHSGDIVRAPNGACEFIDVDMEHALSEGHRYLVMSVLVYSGPNFSDHDVCYAGWMTRSKPNSNEIFDPKTVEQRIDLQVDSKKAVPVIFDMLERKAIWLDLSTGRGYDNMVRPNNVQSNKPSLFDTVTSALNLGNKPNLYDLFEFHAQSRADWLVEDPEDADIRFGWDGDVTPYDTTTILADYL